MYKTKMNDVPPSVRPKICRILNAIGKESVHMGYESMIKNDDNTFVVIARDKEPADYLCYAVFNYDLSEDKLIRGISGITYADALVEMGGRINE